MKRINQIMDSMGFGKNHDTHKGPWKFERIIGRDKWGKAQWDVLPNVTRATADEADQLIDRMERETGIRWQRTPL
jgi:hypothetical protein